jgi:hypothetical protein
MIIVFELENYPYLKELLQKSFGGSRKEQLKEQTLAFAKLLLRYVQLKGGENIAPAVEINSETHRAVMLLIEHQLLASQHRVNKRVIQSILEEQEGIHAELSYQFARELLGMPKV